MKRLLIAAAATAGLLALGACNTTPDEDMAADDAAAEAGMDASAEGGASGGSDADGGYGGSSGGAASAGDAGSDASASGGMQGGSSSTSSGGTTSTDGQAYDPVTEGQGGANLEGDVQRPTEPEHPARS